jgi:hypothetical protein
MVRDHVAASEAMLETLRAFLLALPVEHRNSAIADDVKAHAVQLRAALRALRPWYEAHQANQFHRDSVELAEARRPVLELPTPEPMLW